MTYTRLGNEQRLTPVMTEEEANELAANFILGTGTPDCFAKGQKEQEGRLVCKGQEGHKGSVPVVPQEQL
jgi:hypothetical protein